MQESFLTGTNATYLEWMLESYKKDPTLVADLNLREYFNKMNTFDGKVSQIQQEMPATQTAQDQDILKMVSESKRISKLIMAFQSHGHKIALLDPLGLRGQMVLHHAEDDFLEGKYIPPDLNYRHYGFSESDLDRTFYVNRQLGFKKLRDILEFLINTYSGTCAIEFMHIPNEEEREYIKTAFENLNTYQWTKEEKTKVLENVVRAEEFEDMLFKKFRTHKTFGCKGLEAVVSTINACLERCADYNMKRIFVAMAHRGRLNFLANVMDVPCEDIFGLFQEFPVDHHLFDEGDMKYHMGARNVKKIKGKSLAINLAHNPSHLEAVDPVVYGKTRGKQFLADNKDLNSNMALLIHGDAAFAGQGVVYETLQMQDLKYFQIGGAIHVIMNNQIGFTTDPRYGRSSFYCTDLAKALNIPIFHINADNPEQAAYIAKIAVDYRNRYQKDAIIDLIGFRRFGHNEQDDPTITQPQMYRRIANHPGVVSKYKEKLKQEGVITDQEALQIQEKWREYFNDQANKAKGYNYKKYIKAWQIDFRGSPWQQFFATQDKQKIVDEYKTGVSQDELIKIAEKTMVIPESKINLHKVIAKTYQERLESIKNGKGITFGCAEQLAFATLLKEGHNIRLTGEDVARGTFVHRHAKLFDQIVEGRRYVPLHHVVPDQGEFYVHNSHLSEFAVLGFEYGYSLMHPKQLTIWEAQFGDFANGAQICIDQFIMTGERKWSLQTPLTLLLPHGYEGQGSEHSNGRPERFLANSESNPFEINWEACNQNQQIYNSNIQICNLSTPGNYFHVLRRQMHRPFRKPLILFMTKRLLRTPISNIEELTADYFQRVIPDSNKELLSDQRIRKVILVSGQLSYELETERGRKDPVTGKWHNDIAIVRIEQWAPVPYLQIKQQLERYPNAEIIYAQEEHVNFGPFPWLEPRLNNLLKEMGRGKVGYVGRQASAVAATGYIAQHKNEVASILKNAFK